MRETNPSYLLSKHTKYLGVVITYILSQYQGIIVYCVRAQDSRFGDPVNTPKTSMKELIEQMSHFERFVTLYFPLLSMSYEWNKRGLKSMTCGLTKVPKCPIIAISNEKTI